MITRKKFTLLIVFVSLSTVFAGCGSLGGIPQSVGGLLGGILGAPAKALKSSSTHSTKKKRDSEKSKKALQDLRVKRNYSGAGK